MIKAINRYKNYFLTPLRSTGTLKESSRVFLAVPGIVVLVFSLINPDFRRPDGWLLPEAWLLAVASMALALTGIAWRTRWQKFSLLLSVALVGQGSALLLIHAPNYNILQHYLPWQDLLGTPRGLLLLGPAIQTLVVGWMLFRLRDGVISLSQRLVAKPTALVLLGILLLLAANGSFDVGRYGGEVVLASWVLVVNAANVALVALAVPNSALSRVTEWARQRFYTASDIEDKPSANWGRFLPWGVALWVAGISAAISWGVFDGIPHVPDGVSHLIQAKYFSAG